MGASFVKVQKRESVEDTSQSELKRSGHLSQSMHNLVQDEQDYIKDYFEHEISTANDHIFTDSLVTLVKLYLNCKIECTKQSEQEYNAYAIMFQEQYCGVDPQCDWKSLNTKLNVATSLLENVEHARNEHQLIVELDAIMQVKWSLSVSDQVDLVPLM